jgi:hypothetical protein
MPWRCPVRPSSLSTYCGAGIEPNRLLGRAVGREDPPVRRPNPARTSAQAAEWAKVREKLRPLAAGPAPVRGSHPEAAPFTTPQATGAEGDAEALKLATPPGPTLVFSSSTTRGRAIPSLANTSGEKPRPSSHRVVAPGLTRRTTASTLN